MFHGIETRIGNLSLLFSILLMIFSKSAQALPAISTRHFVITRNGMQIGNCTIRLRRERGQTNVEMITHVQVKLAFITLYRFDQFEAEQWKGRHLMTMRSQTDDNGTTHRVVATNHGTVIAVEADARAFEVSSAIHPASLWSSSLIRSGPALDIEDGRVIRLAVVDDGEEQLSLPGHLESAHRYSITSPFREDVWYDAGHRLLQVRLLGSDGSLIEYHLDRLSTEVGSDAFAHGEF